MDRNVTNRKEHMAAAEDEVRADEQSRVAGTKPFGTFLQEQRGGGLTTELGRELAKVVKGVIDHGKKGVLTLEISVAPGKVDSTLVITDKVTPKVPQADRPAALFFADDDGNLSRRDPRQPQLEGLREA